MGVETVVEVDGGEVHWEQAMARLAASGVKATVVMIDGALVMPGTKVPAQWMDVRVKTAAGTFSVKRRDGRMVAVVAFGNAGEDARAMQASIADALAGDRV